jgi:hypothetical protein
MRALPSSKPSTGGNTRDLVRSQVVPGAGGGAPAAVPSSWGMREGAVPDVHDPVSNADNGADDHWR